MMAEAAGYVPLFAGSGPRKILSLAMTVSFRFSDQLRLYAGDGATLLIEWSYSQAP